ncbi:Leucine Rich repeats (2 copies) [Popillia japonica]|uniref:Leucine Rich repeats (2 copies) n=1 Tax=Popillia japonica TaxID=7064 RepID=A0AAW1KL05_POPJA
MTKSGKDKISQEPNKSSNKIGTNRKVTHLYLNDKYLTGINSFNGYIHLTVLYLHNNYIEKLQNLNNLSNLRALYLQRNKIKKIENLEGLVKLQRLYLGHNEINVVENLENLRNLEELHIEKQNLAGGEKLCFDPRTIHCLSNCIGILNISQNNMTTIQMLFPLKYLRVLNASNNNITELANITDTLQHLTYLREANFFGNPVAKQHRYRETIIGKSISLKTLDRKDITDITRSFIKRFEIEKSNFESKDITDVPSNITDLVKSYPLSLQKAVSNFMLKPVKSSENNGLLNISNGAYVPWKSMPATFSGGSFKTPPLLRKKKKAECRTMNLSSLPNLL